MTQAPRTADQKPAFVAALPLLAVTITRDPRLVSVVTAVTYLPWMVLSLPAGALVDRYDRATLTWRAQAAQAAVVAVVTVLVIAREVNIAVLAVAGLLLGSAEVIFSNAAQSVLPGPGATRAAGAGGRLLAFAWSIPALYRIELYIEPWNAGSVKTAERAGYEREGLLRSHQRSAAAAGTCSCTP
jgi:MFS family permease